LELNIITGVRGFVGGNLEQFFKSQNKQVLGISRKSEGKNISYENLNSELINTSRSFIHLAGKAHDLKNTYEDSIYFEVNTELTKRLFDQFLDSKCEVFIYISSVKAVADKLDEQLTEDHVPSPVTVYGKSKLAAEKYILSKKISKNKRVYILRPCMIHGPNNKGNLNLLYSFISKGIPYPFGKYKNKRSFVSVDNLCFIINELIDNKIASGVYNVADDDPLSTNDLVKLICNILGKPNRILNLPKLFTRFIAKAGDFLPIPINTERLLKLTENYEVSNLKIKNAINKNLPLSSTEGIKKTFESFVQ
jgi:nucleoside-diphosphate-sugar epimerase